MTNIILSFCIPTYNRPERINEIINQILSFQSFEIEIVIGDDNPKSNKTEKVVKKFNDPRIKYFRNKVNLGMDGNMLKTIKKASGEFVFIQMDDDDIEMETIPWIVATIKENKNLSQLCGVLGDKRHEKNTPFFKPFYGNVLLKRGLESVKKLLFHYHHGSGIVLRKGALDLRKAAKNIFSFWIQQTLIAQALMAGDTLCSRKVFAYFGEIEYESDHTHHTHLQGVGHVYYEKFRLQIVYDILKKFPNTKKLKKQLLKERKSRIFYCFRITNTIKGYIDGFGVIFTTKLSRSLSFWISLIINIIFSFIRKDRRVQGIVNIFNKYYLKDHIF